MKTIIIIFSIFLSHASYCQNLTPEEQKQLLQDVKMLKDKVKALESEKSSSGGLKSTDYNSATTATTTATTGTPAATTPEISGEQMKEMMDGLSKVKSEQAEQQKALKQIEDEDE